MATKKTVLDDLLSNPYTLIAVDNGSAYSLYISDAETYEQNDSLPSDAKPVGSSSVISGPAGGDLSGNYPNPTVARLRGVPVSNTPPSSGQALIFDGSVWKPQTIPSTSGNIDLGSYLPDTKPSNPSQYDDEFEGAALDSKWETDNITIAELSIIETGV